MHKERICQYNLHFLNFLKIVVEICQENIFFHMLPNGIFQNLTTALCPQPSPQFLLYCYFVKQD